MAPLLFCQDRVALELLSVARSKPNDQSPRLVLADWLDDYAKGGDDGALLAELLRISFTTDKLVRLPDSVAERLHPFIGALNGWFHGRQNNLRDPIERAWLMPPGSIEIASNIWMEMVYIPSGKFFMGNQSEDRDDKYENLHEVVITKPFFIGKYQVTQCQWQAVMSNNPSRFIGQELPVERVTWKDVNDLCEKIKKIRGHDVMMPTEAQWEYSCRAGTTTAYHFGDEYNGSKANCGEEFTSQAGKPKRYVKKTTYVGSYMPNDWGLYDMHGNVDEWCNDWDGPYPKGPIENPTGGPKSGYRILRGGSWDTSPINCRSATRYRFKPNSRYLFDYRSFGCRLVLLGNL